MPGVTQFERRTGLPIGEMDPAVGIGAVVAALFAEQRMAFDLPLDQRQGMVQLAGILAVAEVGVAGAEHKPLLGCQGQRQRKVQAAQLDDGGGLVVNESMQDFKKGLVGVEVEPSLPAHEPGAVGGDEATLYFDHQAQRILLFYGRACDLAGIDGAG